MLIENGSIKKNSHMMPNKIKAFGSKTYLPCLVMPNISGSYLSTLWNRQDS